MKPRALDLFCKAGGASKGLADAGFDVLGVDIEPQPRYVHGAGAFIQADALRPPVNLCDFDFIWASPPCQHYTWAAACRRNAGTEYPDLVAPVRAMLSRSGVPFVIENVPGAPLRSDLKITGPMVGLSEIWRPRIFELGRWFALAPAPMRKPARPVTVAGHHFRKADGARAMGIDWMSHAELANAIPPAYAEYIGREFLRQRRELVA